MNRFRIIVPFVLLLAVPLTARAELASMQDSLVSRFNAYSALCSPEKVYLHYDRSCFTAGETIWFKGWTMEASRRSALPPSNFIYAEILDKSGEAVVRVKVSAAETDSPDASSSPTIWKRENTPSGHIPCGSSTTIPATCSTTEYA